MIKHPTIVMHPSLGYEDFIEGLRVSGKEPGHIDLPTDGGSFYEPTGSTPESMETNLNLREGAFLAACRQAWADPVRDHLVVLDEFNRANLPRVFGELLLAIEDSKRGPCKGEAGQPSDVVRLAYSGLEFWVPRNLYILATMNTTDESVAPIDAALRRRFWFVRVDPPESQDELDELKGKMHGALESTIDLWVDLNTILKKTDIECQLGESYLWDIDSRVKRVAESAAEQVIADSWQYDILPAIGDILTRTPQQSDELSDSINARLQKENGELIRLKSWEFKRSDATQNWHLRVVNEATEQHPSGA